jgi:hypothetical protein
VERLILESQQRYPNDLDAGIEHAMQEMHGIISDAEHGNAEAVAEVGRPTNMLACCGRVLILYPSCLTAASGI